MMNKLCKRCDIIEKSIGITFSGGQAMKRQILRSLTAILMCIILSLAIISGCFENGTDYVDSDDFNSSYANAITNS